MTNSLIVTDLQGLVSGGSSYVELFELQISTTTWLHFANYLAESGSPDSLLQFRDYDTPSTINTYYPIPTSISGIDHKAEGPIAQPRLTIANVLSTGDNYSLIGALGSSIDYEALLGLKFIRRRTLEKYLYPTSATNPPIEFSRDIYFLDRIENQDSRSITFVLVSPLDLTNIKLPRRTIIGNACPWKYKGAAPNLDQWEKKGGCFWHTEGEISSDQSITNNIYVNQDDEYILPSSVAPASVWVAGSNAAKNTLYKTVQAGLSYIQADGSITRETTFTPSGNVNISTEVLTITGHNFRTGDLIQYTNGGGGAFGLTDESTYFLGVTGNSITFHLTEATAIAGTSKVNLTSNAASGTAHKLSPASFNYWQATDDLVTPADPNEADGNWNRVQIYRTYSSAFRLHTYGDDRYNDYLLYNSIVWKTKGFSQIANSHVSVPEISKSYTYGDSCGKRLTSCAKRFTANIVLLLGRDGVSGGFVGANTTIVGQTSNATAHVINTSGTNLILSNIKGTFLNNETITEDGSPGGTALVNGTLQLHNGVPSTDLNTKFAIPFGGFPTARVF